ncbi:hypothetical protein H072_1698 [Dactylellina haptotyla CBS 200.50]|uniref:C2 NT-type domain-containing protein n=1 Tax=Dactylellina haptotyla (strain CBS 200.50) TaxID=1284197 RepID=S8C9D2_DACHA|nr:hypothetical protein H072_1698 [Dactylellina haptotyla CBS 200.50]
MHTFVVPKSRRPRFNLKLQVHDLNNVPLVSGLAYVKWHIRDSPLAESRGRTSKIPIKEHRVTWRYTKELVVKMTVDRSGMLSPVYLDLEIIQEYSGRERIILGTLELNLAEYVGREREHRRYLMQASKINSTVQISTELKQISGDINFKVPELRPAQVFSGIAGVVMSEPLASDTVEANSTQATESPYGTELSNISAHSRERDRIQDIYRKSLAASWQLQTGELNAVDCIEDIFAGGSGWAVESDQRGPARADTAYSSVVTEDNDHRATTLEHVSSQQSSNHRTAGWQHSNDSSWKRARGSQNLERHIADFTTQGISPSLGSRSNSHSVHKSNSPRSNLLVGRSAGINRSASTSDQTYSTLSSGGGNSGRERTPIGHTQSQNWHSLEVAEEDLRDNLVSWSL